MIDDEETDWKLVITTVPNVCCPTPPAAPTRTLTYTLNQVCIDADDPWADSVNDIDDIDNVFPGLLFTVREWFRNYKVHGISLSQQNTQL